MSIIPEPRKLRQENHWFEANLSYIARLCLNTHTHTNTKHQWNRRKEGKGRREDGRECRTAGSKKKEMLDRDTLDAESHVGFRLKCHLKYVLSIFSLSPPPALAPAALSEHFRKSDEINKHYHLAPLRKSLWHSSLGGAESQV